MMPPGAVNAVDGFAMAMIVILALSLGVVALLASGIYRSGKRKQTEVDQLLEELRQEEKPGKHLAQPQGGESREPWEKDGDWWKE